VGEIAEALRRAHAERASRSAQESGAEDVAPRDPQDDVYSQSARRHEQESGGPPPPASEPRRPSPPAPRPAEVGRPAASATPTQADPDAIRLTQQGHEARASQAVLIDEGGAITDACLQLALRVRKSLQAADARSLMIASAMRNEGKTTVSCNLALALASLGQVDRVALVDLDLRRPSLHSVLELPSPGCGIEDVIGGGQPLERARVPISAPSLDVYPCLRGQVKAHELLLRPAFPEMLQTLRERYQFVILDSPPSLLVPDATIIMQHVECFAPVARSGITRTRSFRKMLDMLPPRSLLGAILDGGATSIRKGYYAEYSPDPEPDDG